MVLNQLRTHFFFFIKRPNESFRAFKFREYRFGRFRREQILAELLKGGGVWLGCFAKLYGGLLQFRLRLSGIKGGSLQVDALGLEILD
jgi:hypothetical protein